MRRVLGREPYLRTYVCDGMVIQVGNGIHLGTLQRYETQLRSVPLKACS